MVEASPKMMNYFDNLELGVKTAFNLATQARKKGFDPSNKVDVSLAKNMAERVQGLISVVAPQIVGSGVVERIVELESQYGVLDWRVALKIALEMSQEIFCKFKDKREAMEVGIRTGFAYVTVGVVSSPLEGFTSLEIKPRRDGKGEYFCMNFSGPIRNAGGTGASLSVLIGDYVRTHMGYQPYDADEKEIERITVEITEYHERVTNLQYFPSKKEIDFMGKYLPIEISGDPSEKYEIPTCKDLPRIKTNIIRSGYCLIHSSCLPLKAPKLWKQLSKWGDEFGLSHWNFLDEFLKIQKEAKAAGAAKKQDENKPKILPDYTFIKDLVAGRPILAHPLRVGGFRLRYGRSRTSGLAGKSLHPATLGILDDFIAIGTTVKIERPGKGAGITPCDTIEGPIVLMDDGSVLKIKSLSEAKKVRNKVKEILFLGDVLVNHGDFMTYAHSLIPPGYCEEWWILELEKATVDTFGTLDIAKVSELTDVDEALLEKIFKDPIRISINSKDAIKLSEYLKVPLHPEYTYHWATISKDQLLCLLKGLKLAKLNDLNKLVIPVGDHKRVLELLGIPHIVVMKENIVISPDYSRALLVQLGLLDNLEAGLANAESLLLRESDSKKSLLDLITELSKVAVRDKSGTFIGGRMSRPEKAKMRKLTGSPHVLFPVGEEGGRLRCFQSALEAKKISAEFPTYLCDNCNRETIYPCCEVCKNPTQKKFYCKTCGLIDANECQHGKAQPYRKTDLDIVEHFRNVLNCVGLKVYPDLIKGVRGTSNSEHVPEHLVKGILRAKHNIYVNKDGTIRYDATETGITHFKPKEISVSVERLRELGYTHDVYGKELSDDDQILELCCQDVILPCSPDSPDEPADEVFYRVTKYIDELLKQFYNLEPYYKLNTKKDLAGHLIVGLAPHTSAGIVGRIIGFSKTQSFLAHPMFHQAMRRDCDGDESCMILMVDVFLNYSNKYLPSHRGSTMDAPLVLTSILAPSEVDDQVFDMDIVWKYPLQFYEAALEYKMPWEFSMKKIKDVLGTPEQYEGMGFTHDTDDFNDGVLCSSYKTLPSMQDKLDKQMRLAEKIRAVDTSDVARLVIEKHFIRDTKGNLRKFSQQAFRCVKCNEIYRRPPLRGACKCGGKIIFTISEGSIIKYLEPSINLAKKYNVPAFLQQSLELLKRRVEGVFGKEKEVQSGLGAWVK